MRNYLGMCVMLAACSKPATEPPRSEPAPSVTASSVVVADAPPAPKTGAQPVVLGSLPILDVPAITKRGQATDVFAVDADLDRLIAQLADHQLIATPTGKRVTGAVTSPHQTGAFVALLAQAGLPTEPTALPKGVGATVDMSLAAAPVLDLLRFVAETGRVDIIASPSLSPLTTLMIVTHDVPWDSVLAGIAAHTGHTVTRVGRTHYLLPRGTTLPPLAKGGGSAKVSIHMRAATVGQVLAAVRQLTPVPEVGPCDATVAALSLRDVSVPEILRALGVATGQPLTALPAGATCASTPLTATTDLGALKLVAIAKLKTTRAATLARGTNAITATVAGGVVRDIGEMYVDIDPHPFLLHDVDDGHLEPEADVRRVSALVRIGDRWTALLELADGASRTVAPAFEPSLTIDADGVHGPDGVMPLARWVE